MKRLLLTILVLLPVTVTGTGGFTEFFWTENDPADQVTGYIMSCGNQPGTYTASAPIAKPPLPIANVVTADGQYYCAVQAENSSGKSGYSSEVSFFIKAGVVYDLLPPAAPQGLGVR